jgi:hypothetical protein
VFEAKLPSIDIEHADINERTKHLESLWFSNPEEEKKEAIPVAIRQP